MLTIDAATHNTLMDINVNHVMYLVEAAEDLQQISVQRVLSQTAC